MSGYVTVRLGWWGGDLQFEVLCFAEQFEKFGPLLFRKEIVCQQQHHSLISLDFRKALWSLDQLRRLFNQIWVHFLLVEVLSQQLKSFESLVSDQLLLHHILHLLLQSVNIAPSAHRTQ